MNPQYPRSDIYGQYPGGAGQYGSPAMYQQPYGQATRIPYETSPMTTYQQPYLNPRELSSMPSPTLYASHPMEKNFSNISSASSASTKTSDGNAPWLCLVCPHSSARKADLERHYAAKHCDPALRPRVDCPFAGCSRVGAQGLPRADKLREHLREVHGEELEKKAGRRAAR